MSGPIASSLALPPVDCEDLASLVDQLNDDQRRFVVQQLLPSILAEVREPRSITDADGQLLGYFIPMKSLDGNDLLRASVSESGTFRVIPATVATPHGQAMKMPRRRKEKDLFEADIGGSD